MTDARAIVDALLAASLVKIGRAILSRDQRDGLVWQLFDETAARAARLEYLPGRLFAQAMHGWRRHGDPAIAIRWKAVCASLMILMEADAGALVPQGDPQLLAARAQGLRELGLDP